MMKMAKTYIEKSLFLQFFGDKPKFRIIDFMLENDLSDFTKTDIAKGAGLSWASLFAHWGDMERKKIVKLTRTVGRAKLYKLNTDNMLVLKMVDLYNAVLAEKLKAARQKGLTVKA